MKHYPAPAAQPRHAARFIPPFHAVPVRRRADGWTPLRQAEFIGHLAATRSVAAAARKVGMARETAYRLRDKPGAQGFVCAWEAALAAAGSPLARAAIAGAREALRARPKVTLGELHWRVETGVWQVILRAGRYAGVRRKPDNPALLALLARTRPAESRDEAE